MVGANFLNAIIHSKSHQSSLLLTCLASAASDTSEYLNISFVRLVEDGEERMQSSDYRPEVRRHSVICQVSSVCTRLFTLCSHRASSDHRPPVSEAFVAAARAEGAGRGGAGRGRGTWCQEQPRMPPPTSSFGHTRGTPAHARHSETNRESCPPESSNI